MRRGEPLVAGRKLLVADRGVLGADEIVLRLVGRERVLGVAKPFLQFLEPARQIGRRPPRGGGLRLLRFRKIGVGNRVREHRRLGRVMRPDLDVDDEAAIGLLDIDVTVQDFQRRRLAELGFGGRPDLDTEQAEQRCQHAPGLAAELRILVQMGVLDHLQQHAVRGDQARLAFDHHGEAGKILGARREFAIDQLQFAGIDIKLGGRRIFRRQALADRNRERRRRSARPMRS